MSSGAKKQSRPTAGGGYSRRGRSRAEWQSQRSPPVKLLPSNIFLDRSSTGDVYLIKHIALWRVHVSTLPDVPTRFDGGRRAAGPSAHWNNCRDGDRPIGRGCS